jgi:O-antigen ligase
LFNFWAQAAGMTTDQRFGRSDLMLLQAAAIGFLALVFAAALAAPSCYWPLLGLPILAGIGFLALRHTIVFCAAWLLVTGCTLEMTLNDMLGPSGFTGAIAAVKTAGIGLAVLCAWRYGPRLDLLNPAWAFAVIGITGFMHGLYPGLSAGDSLRSFAGSAAPYAFGFCRPSRAWAQAMIRTTIWCPIAAVAAGSVLAVTDIRPLFIESGGLRLTGLGHPAFLAGVCLPAIYAGLIELWRDGRPVDRVLLAVNLLILLLTGARAPLAYALSVGALTLLTVPSDAVTRRERLLVVLIAAIVLPPLAVLADNLTAVRLFAVLTSDSSNLSGREYLWPPFEAAAASSPWFGWGLGAGNVIIPPESAVARLLHTWAAHNEYLRMAVEGGQLGRALLILFFAAWAWRHTARLPAAERRIMRFVFVAFAAHAATDNVLISTPACVLFTFAAAVFARREAAPALCGAARKA